MSVTWRQRKTSVFVCLVAAIGVAAAVAATSASASASGRSGRAAAAARCTTAHLEIWFGLGLGGGTAGSTYYPLEFSNVGHQACTLNGYPGVSGFGSNGAQVGPAATRKTGSHGTVTLAPSATAHALLRVVDAGALCSPSVTAAGLKVFPPGATRSQPIPFSFAACSNRGVLIVGPVRGGVGIPGFTTS
jgi:hypothetical protein